MNDPRKARLAVLLALGLLLLIVSVAWYLRESRGYAPRSIPLPTPVEAQPEAAKAEDVPERRVLPEAAIPARVLPGETLRALATGRVLDERGKPIAHAHVALSGAGPVLSASTDEAGRFHFEQVRAFGCTWSLRVEAAGLPALERRETGMLPPAFDFGDLVLRSGASVSGCVVDALGRGIEGARVSWIATDSAMVTSNEPGTDGGRSAAGGRFTIQGLPRVRIALTATKDGFRADWTKPLALDREASPPEVRIELEPALLVHGHVREAGTGVGLRATVSLWMPQRSRGVTLDTGPMGEFEAWAGAPSCTLLAQARREGYTQKGKDQVVELGPPGSAVPELSFELSAEHAIDVLVLDATSGAPLPGAELCWPEVLMLSAGVPVNPLLCEAFDVAARADETGHIRVEPCEEAWRGALIRARDHAPRACKLAELRAENACVRLDSGGTLQVHVQRSGAAAAGARLELATEAPAGYWRDHGLPDAAQPRVPVAIAESGGDGTATFACLPPGTYTLRVRAAALSSAEQDGVLVKAGETTSIRVEAVGACSIHGRVTHDRAPSPSVRVLAERGFGRHDWASTDAEGRYRLSGLPPGKYGLITLRPGSEGASQTSVRECTLQPGEDAQVDLEELSTSRLCGSARIDGVPAVGLEVRFQREPDRRFYGVGSQEHCLTDPQGHFELEVPADSSGRLSLVARNQRWTEIVLAVRERVSTSEPNAPLDFEIETGALEVEVVHPATGKPVEDWMRFDLRPDREAGGVPGIPDDFEWPLFTQFGRRILRGLPAGHYLMHTVAAGSTPDTQTKLGIAAGTTETLRIEYEPRK